MRNPNQRPRPAPATKPSVPVPEDQQKFLVPEGDILRETEWYVMVKRPSGKIVLCAKDEDSFPRSKGISPTLARQLNNMSDPEFDQSIVFEIGVGTWSKD